MKKSIALILAVSALMLAGCSNTQDSSKTGSEKSAIESVFAQRAKLKAEEGQASLFSKQSIPSLMAIDVGNCPADFRSAWFDYLVEVENLHTRMERVAGFASAEGTPVTDVPSLVKFAVTNPRLGEYLLGALNRADEAYEKLARSAMNYGVMPER